VVLKTDNKCSRFGCCLYTFDITLFSLVLGTCSDELTCCKNGALRPDNMMSVCKVSNSCYNKYKKCQFITVITIIINARTINSCKGM